MSVDREEIFMQNAPFPVALKKLVNATRYKPAWTFELHEALDRGQGSYGLTLVIQITTPDSYHPDQLRKVAHYFPVPPAAYDMRSWRRWLFERVLLVERHEAMEFFALATDEYELDTPCQTCGHAATKHDGRNSSCADCDGPGLNYGTHRFQVRAEDIVYTRPFAPSHGPGNDPYLVREVGTEKDVRTSFRGVLS